MNLLPLALIVSAVGSPWEADRHVREGIQRYAQGDLATSAQAFDDALEDWPEHPRIVFNQGCVLAREGKFDEARKALRNAALATDTNVAVLARFNLGAIDVEEARKVLGTLPDEASGEDRTEGLRLLSGAVRNFKSCLELDPGCEKARENIEMVRIWIHRMRAIWARKDRQRALEGLDVMALLEKMDLTQRQLRRSTRALNASDMESKAVAELADQERELVDVLPVFRRKLNEADSAGQPSDPGLSPSSPPASANSAALAALVDDVESAMISAADRLDQRRLGPSLKSQDAVVDGLHAIRLAITPFPDMVRQSVKRQSELVRRSGERIAAVQPGEVASTSAELAESQEQVAQFAQGLVTIAQATMAPMAEPPPRDDRPTPNDKSPPPLEPTPTGDNAGPLRPAMEKTLENGSAIESKCVSAARLLADGRWGEGLPHQEQSLRLLKEIEDRLPKDSKPTPPPSEGGKDQESEKPNEPKQPPNDGESKQDNRSNGRDSAKKGDRNHEDDERKQKDRKKPREQTEGEGRPKEKDAKSKQGEPQSKQEDANDASPPPVKESASEDSGETAKNVSKDEGAKALSKSGQGEPTDQERTEPRGVPIEQLIQMAREREQAHRRLRQRIERARVGRSSETKDW